MDDEALEMKFKDQCAGVFGEKVDAASEVCWGTENAHDVGTCIYVLFLCA
jgi:hypothetical protein